MSVKNLIICGVVLVIIIMAIILINVGDSNSKAPSGIQVPENISVLSIEKVEEQFENAVKQCETQFRQDNLQSFGAYINVDNINTNMVTAKVELVTDIATRNFETIDIYDLIGNKLEGFPMNEIDTENIDNSIEIQPNKNYLMRIYNEQNAYSYYYVVSFGSLGTPRLKQICYSVGEEAIPDSSVIPTTEENVE